MSPQARSACKHGVAPEQCLVCELEAKVNDLITENMKLRLEADLAFEQGRETGGLEETERLKGELERWLFNRRLKISVVQISRVAPAVGERPAGPVVEGGDKT